MPKVGRKTLGVQFKVVAWVILIYQAFSFNIVNLLFQV